MAALAMTSCSDKKVQNEEENFQFLTEQFADLKIMRYLVPDFDSLSLRQKELVYYLSEAAKCGRDITYDQNCKYNLLVRHTCEQVAEFYSGDRESADFEAFLVYLKRVWFSNGIHHHYSNDKFYPEMAQPAFRAMLEDAKHNGAQYAMHEGEKESEFYDRITRIIFDSTIAPKKVCSDVSVDLVVNSAGNFYDGVTQEEAERFYEDMREGKDTVHPIAYGLNSQLAKVNGRVVERTYKLDGMYAPAIERIVYWLNKAAGVAENEAQRKHILTLIDYYTTGDLKTWDDYNILWAQDVKSHVDYVNGFIEDYDDPMGMKATWEGLVNFKNIQASHRTDIISQNAQWFEDNSPVDPRFKKPQVKGISAKVITVAMLGGACSPSTPIGINLPNSNWIRKEYGSKSVTIDNITYAYAQAALKGGVSEEFYFSKAEVERNEKYGMIADALHTDMHECVGHASGQLLPDVSENALSNYNSTSEEARADLFALYYMLDPKMVELGLLPSLDAGKAGYYQYMTNGIITQLTRIKPGDNIEEAHMRNRALIARWCFAHGEQDNVMELVKKNGKTYLKINDYDKLRTLIGELLAEVQRVKSTGDYKGAQTLVETYGVKVNPALHKEVLDRYAKLNIAPYGGFINPEYELIEKDGKLVDIKVKYPNNFYMQMMNYSKNYSLLPIQ